MRVIAATTSASTVSTVTCMTLSFEPDLDNVEVNRNVACVGQKFIQFSGHSDIPERLLYLYH